VSPDRPSAGQRPLDDELAMIAMMTGRGDLAAARALCHRLLEDAPHEARLLAAMGDISVADGAWVDAVDWYERALEADFDPTVMQRLAGARSRSLHPGAAPSTASATPAAPVAPSTRAPAGPAVAGGSQARGQARDRQIIGIVIAVVVIMSLTTVFLVRSANRRPERPRSATTPQAAVPAAAQPSRAAAPQPSGAPATPAVPAATPADGAAPVRHTGQAPRPAEAPLPPAVITTSREHQLLRRMHMEKWGEGTRVSGTASMASDPYTGQSIITIHAPRTAEVWQFEADILTATYRIALSALRNDQDLQTVVVRCVGTVAGEDGQEEEVPVFRAAVPRARVVEWLQRSDMPSFEQMNQGIFEGVWWDKNAEARCLDRQSRRPAPRADEEDDWGQ
jgi:hypothetical protein